MTRKVISLKDEGIVRHINRYFVERDIDKRYGDVLYWKNLKIGGRHISMSQQMTELGINSRSVLYRWHREIDEQV